MYGRKKFGLFFYSKQYNKLLMIYCDIENFKFLYNYQIYFFNYLKLI